MIIVVKATSDRARAYLKKPETVGMKVKNAINNRVFKSQTGLDLKACINETTHDGVLTAEIVDPRVLAYISKDMIIHSIHERMREQRLNNNEDYTVEVV